MIAEADASGPPETVAIEREAATFRLDPAIERSLEVLGQRLKMPLDRLVNEAVQTFVERSLEVDPDLRRIVATLRSSREKDPAFEAAIERFVDAEASLGQSDPVEGKPAPQVGPVQSILHELLR